MIAKHSGNSLLFSQYADLARAKLGQRGKLTRTNTPEVPGNTLTGKIDSRATTEYGKVLASGNITINSGNFKNRDSIISGGGLVNINATNFENSVTLGNAVQLKNGQEKLYLNIDTGAEGAPQTELTADTWRMAASDMKADSLPSLKGQ